MLSKLIDGFLEYFKHESTWKGLIVLATVAGVTFSPEQQSAIVATGMSLYGLFQVFIQDRNVQK